MTEPRAALTAKERGQPPSDHGHRRRYRPQSRSGGPMGREQRDYRGYEPFDGLSSWIRALTAGASSPSESCSRSSDSPR